jgi:hypothetical protein
MVDRELDDSNYSEEVRKGWKGARCIDSMGYGVWKYLDLLRMIEGRG